MKRGRPSPWTPPLRVQTNPFADFFEEEFNHEVEPEPTAPPGGKGSDDLVRQSVVLQTERKGRGGKTVTVIRGLTLSPRILNELSRELRQLCGAGGSVQGDAIEIQGDQRDRLKAALTSRGARVRGS